MLRKKTIYALKELKLAYEMMYQDSFSLAFMVNYILGLLLIMVEIIYFNFALTILFCSLLIA